MDAYSSELSDVEDSQASQVLRDLVIPDSSPVKFTGTPARPARIVLPADFSDSFNSSRNSNSLPTYDLHGLVATQTQTQLEGEGDDEALQGSQKENIHEGDTVHEGRRTPSPFGSAQAHDSPSKAALAETTKTDKGAHSLAHSKTRTPNARPLPISSLEPPTSKSQSKALGEQHDKSGNIRVPMPTARATRQSRTAAPPSPIPTEDSFAIDPELKRTDFYLSNFNIPLAELAESQEDSESNSMPRDTTLGYTLGGSGGIIARQQGNLLVDATPTNSASSQVHPSPESPRDEQATQLLDTQLASQREGNQSQGRDLLSQPSSDGRSVMGPNWQPTPEPTQLATQIDDFQMYDATSGPTAPSIPPSGTNAMHSIPQTDQGKPHSLLAHLPAARQQRYGRFVRQSDAGPSIPAPLQQVQSNPPARSTTWEETQPTTAEEMAPPPRRQFAPAYSTVRANRAPAAAPSPDRLEIIPDSEAHLSSPQRPVRDVGMASEDEEPKGDAEEDAEGEDQDQDLEPVPKPPFKGKGKQVPRRQKAPPLPALEEDSGEEGLSVPTRKGKTSGKVANLRKRPPPSDSEDEKEEDGAPPAKRRVIEARELSSDDDVPLAAQSSKTVSAKAKAPPKGKGKEKAGLPVAAKGRATKAATKKSTAALAKPQAPPKQTRATRSYEDAVIPSSVPEQDHPPAERKEDKVSETTAFSRSKPQVEETASEPSDDDDLDIIAEEQPPKHDKKRGKAPGKPVVKKEDKHERPVSKQLRSSMADAKENPNATRVFALWKPDNHYYAGTVKRIDDLHYWVHFEDNNEDQLTLDQIRKGRLRVGDEVLVLPTLDRGIKKSSPWRVVDVTRLPDKFITVSHANIQHEVHLQDIRIAHRTIVNSWADRMLPRESIVAQLEPRSTGAPISRPGSRQPEPFLLYPTGRGPLSGTCFVITANSKKANLTQSVRGLGGHVVNEFEDLLSMSGRYEEHDNRWIINKDDVRWRGPSDIQSIFLLADVENQKPKYLMALGLGVPCLSNTWLSACKQKGQTWKSHLLPRGEADHLGTKVSQMVDLNWGTTPSHLTSIMDNPVPLKLFKGASVLCVGMTMFPMPEGQTASEGGDIKAQEAVNGIARVILTMGADRVEAVRQPRHASRPLLHYTYIVTRTAWEAETWEQLPRKTLVDWSWVKKSLIADRLVPLAPQPTGEEHSQEA